MTTTNNSSNLSQNNIFDVSTIPSDPSPVINTQNLNGSSAPSSSSSSSSSTTTMVPSAEAESWKDSEVFSSMMLTYISHILMEDDIDAKFDLYPEDPLLLAAEKPFLAILEKSPAPPNQPPLDSNRSSDCPDKSISGNYRNDNSNNGEAVVIENSWPYDPVEYCQLKTKPLFVDSSSQSSVSSSNSKNFFEWLGNQLVQSQPALQFARGVEEAKNFLPGEDKLVIDSEANGFSLLPEVEEEEHQVHRGQKNPYSEDSYLEARRSNKQAAVYTEETESVRKMLDKILLFNSEACFNSVKELQEAKQSEGATRRYQSNRSKGAGNGKGGRGGKKQPQKKVVDLRTLLTHCAQAVASNDHRVANELLKQIKQHSSPTGDATQRLAHYFADGLQARVVGTGSKKHQSNLARRTPTIDILKAIMVYAAACPFMGLSYYFSNHTIFDAIEEAKSVHIVDYGICYGFQWPCFMQELSCRPGGPPRLRITGIDLPRPGFRPAELIEETGCRLADYAKTFNIPFEFHAIAARYETILVEDLHINNDEVLIVNCLYRSKFLMDETVVVDSPRDIFLNTIRKMNPAVFIHEIVNGSYSAPFFLTRFREAFFHYSAIFDMIETNVPHEHEQRRLIERDIFGWQIYNVISCEGSERVCRPETYKQWQVRSLRAGFKQLPLNAEFMKKASEKMKACHHKDFILDEDNRWLLHGWKGRILYAFSAWKPNDL